MSEKSQGGARVGAGRPAKEWAKILYSMRLASSTVARIERFAASRGLNRTQALETIVEEYTMVLDRLMMPGRWEQESFVRPGLKALRPTSNR